MLKEDPGLNAPIEDDLLSEMLLRCDRPGDVSYSLSYSLQGFMKSPNCTASLVRTKTVALPHRTDIDLFLITLDGRICFRRW